MRELEEELRIFDERSRTAWARKYAHFSGRHMRSTAYKNFAQARHDPFNKGPTWTRRIFQLLGNSCKRNGITLQELFHAANTKTAGYLSREEMRRVILGVKYDLSDAELAHIFNELDAEHGGDTKCGISLQGFCNVVEKAMEAKEFKEIHYQSPVKVCRLPPHLPGNVTFNLEHDVGEIEAPQNSMSLTDRFAEAIKASPRGPRGTPRLETSKYQYFVGGADSERFTRAKRRGLQQPEVPSSPTPSMLTASRQDPSNNAERWVWDSRKRKKVRVPTDAPRLLPSAEAARAATAPAAPANGAAGCPSAQAAPPPASSARYRAGADAVPADVRPRTPSDPLVATGMAFATTPRFATPQFAVL